MIHSDFILGLESFWWSLFKICPLWILSRCKICRRPPASVSRLFELFFGTPHNSQHFFHHDMDSKSLARAEWWWMKEHPSYPPLEPRKIQPTTFWKELFSIVFYSTLITPSLSERYVFLTKTRVMAHHRCVPKFSYILPFCCIPFWNLYKPKDLQSPIQEIRITNASIISWKHL